MQKGQKGLSPEEVKDLMAAFKAGNKKGKEVKLSSFKKIMAVVEKKHPDNPDFSPSCVE